MNTRVDKLKQGDKWSRLSYGTVVGFVGHNVIVRNEKGNEWEIGRSIFEDEFDTVQYTSVEQVTRTEMAQVVLSRPSVVMQVEYRKQPVTKDLVDTVLDMIANPDEYRTKNGFSKIKVGRALKGPTAGKKRTMIGRHNANMNESGRIDFIDMEVTEGSPLRQIDPRTIERVIVGGVCYELK